MFELVDYAIEQHRERKAVAAGATDAAEEDLLGVLLRIQEEGGLNCSLDMGTIKAVILGRSENMPGHRVSLAKVELVLGTFHFHFDWHLPPGVAPSELDMSEEISITLRRKGGLSLHPTVRVPLHGAA
ncbi:hypothetical protein BAE44_0001807 [Dichanthelium oligosanthes]|uniref:Uncharacterized protein n=1 Tax=Dichanthelium oligosanthes TaxID=888268 RepID=A0A1E5WIL0_9POAL|nr:hypothetical protein BAE44_0001807 [Dichanthelium oligosanthes]